MKNIIITSSLILASVFSINAQTTDNEKKAKDILDAVSAKTSTYSTIDLAFKMSAKGQGQNESKSGTAKIKGDSYFLSIDDQKMYSDGKTLWTYLEEDNECYIENAEDNDDFITPTKLLNLWEDGFKFAFVSETETSQTIKLFPLEPAKSKFHTVVVTIDKSKKQIKNATIKMKNGITISYIITSFITNKTIADSTFKFDKSKHPGVTIIED